MNFEIIILLCQHDDITYQSSCQRPEVFFFDIFRAVYKSARLWYNSAIPFQALVSRRRRSPSEEGGRGK